MTVFLFSLISSSCLLTSSASGATALTEENLRQQGFREMACHFAQRCVINLPCEKAWRDVRWFLNNAEVVAYRVNSNDGLSGKARLSLDTRWKERSDARSIVIPMREAVAGHMTVFYGGGAIYTVQYAANPGSGQIFLGHSSYPEAMK